MVIAEATAEAPPPVKSKMEDEIPREMREKLTKAEHTPLKSEEVQGKPNPKVEAVLEAENGKRKGKEKAVSCDEERVSAGADVTKEVKVDKGKQREPDPQKRPPKPDTNTEIPDPGGSASLKIQEKLKGLSPEDRKKYEIYLAQRAKRSKEAQPQPPSQAGDEKPRVLSKEERDAYRLSKSGTSTRVPKSDEKVKIEKDENVTKSRRMKFEDLNDDEKKRYLRERQKRKAKEAEMVKRGSRGEGSSGLTISEKERIKL